MLFRSLNVSKFDLKECVGEYYKDDESYEYCEEMYDMFKSEKGNRYKIEKDGSIKV